jgi:hypothetical protein
MHELIYALRFTGQATPSSADGTVLKAETTAPSSTVTTSVGSDGLTSAVRPEPGGKATFTSEITFTGETSFQEVGTIGFGEGHLLRFTTVGSGYLSASVDPARKHGTVMWRVDGGEGQFAGASGLITSNFFVGEDLTITDYHFGVIALRNEAVD